MRLSKWLLCFLNFLLAGLMAFGVLFLIERLLRQPWDWYSRVLACWPILLCWPVGLAARRLEGLRLALLPAALVLSAVLMVLRMPSAAFPEILCRVLALAPAAALFLVGLKGDEPFPPRIAVAGLLVYLLECLRHGGDPRGAVLCWCGLAALLLSLYSFNSASVTAGVHNVKGGETMSLPSGIRTKNLVLLTFFLCLCLCVANLGFLRSAASAVWQFIWGGISAALKWITSLGTTSKYVAPPSDTPEPEHTVNIGEMVPDGNGTFVTIYGIFWCVVCVLFFLLAYGFAREGKGGGALKKLSDALRRLLRTKQVLEYEDEVERTEDLRTIAKKRVQSVRKALRRVRIRRKRFGDMPDDRSRVRYAYRALLRSRYAEDWRPSLTPTELGDMQKRDTLRRLTETYNQVRYDPDKPVPPEFGLQAAQAVKDMGQR
jgi:hypothetical protein